MLRDALTVASKELVDHSRDTRSLISTLAYTLMGPLIIGALALRAPMGPRLAVVASVFIVVAAFTGGMGVATDTIAGERERRSLLPLILNSRSSVQILLGKWLATACFAIVSSTITFLAFAVAALRSRMFDAEYIDSLAWAIPVLAALGALAAALEIAISAVARNVKEANTYVSILTFLATGIAMWFALRPLESAVWWSAAPVLGHQQILQAGLTGNAAPSPLMTLITTLAMTLIVLAQATLMFRSNEINDRI